jgi:Fic family protein
MTYIWQHPNWPDFTYTDSAIPANRLYQYAQTAGRLGTRLQGIPECQRLDTCIDLMVSEAITTSAIEGEKLNPDDVRSSLKNHLGLNYPPLHVRDPRAQGVSALMVHNFQQTDTRLDDEALFRWHRMLLPNPYDAWGHKLNIGAWRTEGIDVISGPLHKQKVHFSAPPASQVAQEMTRFFNWYAASNPIHTPPEALIPGPVRAAITHLWFVTIHPFDDGNGRIARALADHALAQDARQPLLHSLSTAIERNKRAYYDQLEQAQKGNLDIGDWITWFIDITFQALAITENTIAWTVQKADFLKRHQQDMNQRQLTVVLDLFSNGADGDPRSVNRNKYVKQTGCSPSTALRDLRDLVAKSILVQLPGEGRNTRYGLNI